MNIEVGQVGDLIYDPMSGELGVIIEKTFGLFHIAWRESITDTMMRTVEKHIDFVYHPEFAESRAGYCLANDKEKYYADW